MRKPSSPKKVNRRIEVKQPHSTGIAKRVIAAVKVMLMVVSVGTALGVSGYYGSQAVSQFLNKPIAAVSVSGEFRYLTKEQVSQLVSENISQSFMQENLMAMTKTLEKHPWVDRVSLRRQWPDKLLVEFVEQRPIARWGNSGFVNHRGELIFLSDNNLIKDLPELAGEPTQAFAIMKQYQLLSQLLAPQQLTIKRLRQDALGVWDIQLNNDWLVLMGRTDTAQKVQKLVQLLAQGTLTKQQHIVSIDMRYTSGLAVRWQRGEQSQQQLTIQQYQNDEKNI